MKFRRIAKRPTRAKCSPQAHPLYPVVRAAVIGENLPSAGTADSKYFAPVDVVTVAIPRDDLLLISAALLHVGTTAEGKRDVSPENGSNALELMHRLPGMRLRTKGAIQDKVHG